ncbi:MAG: PEP-CTERM sorting domain-containing protein [Verrucomicrobiota bacterium]
MRKSLVSVLVFLVSCAMAFAANTASDNASDAVYNDAWTTGDNGGTGFGSWTLGGAFNSFWIGDSTLNGNPPTPNEGINVSGESFGLWSYTNGSGLAEGVRSFTGGALAVGQVFKISMDNGWIDSGIPGTVGVALQNSSGENLWEWYFVGGGPSYQINQNGGAVNSGYAYTERGIALSFGLVGSTNFVLDVTGPQWGTSSFTGSLLSAASGESVDRFRVFSANASPGGSANWDFFVNSMEVIPEPGTLGLVGAALAGLLIFRRRR